MTLDARDNEILKAHFDRFKDMDPCPICHARTWEVSGPFALPGAASSGTYAGGAIPLVQLLCQTCFHVRQFAWLGIRDSVAKRTGLTITTEKA